jgi:hypothetical protein
MRYWIIVWSFVGLYVQAQELSPNPKKQKPTPEQMEASKLQWEQYFASGAAIEQSKWKELGPTQSTDNWTMDDYNYRRIRGTGRMHFIEFDPNNPNRILTGSATGGLFISHNGGKKWEVAGTDFLPNPGVSHALFSKENPAEWYILTGDGDNDFSFSYGILRTRDGGKTYESMNGVEQSLPTINLKESWLPVHYRRMVMDQGPNVMLVVGNTGIYRSDNINSPAAQVRWTRVREGAFFDIVSQPGTNGRVLFSGGRETVMSTDGGITWKVVRGSEIIAETGVLDFALVLQTLRISPSNPNKLYLAVTANDGVSSARFFARLYLYDISTGQWTDMDEIPVEVGGQRRMGAGRAQSFAVSPQNWRYIIMGNVSKLWMSEDNGNVFRQATKDFHDDLHWATYGPDGKSIWLATDGGVNVSYDDGITWTDLTVGIGTANMFNMALSEWRPGTFAYGGYDTGTVLRLEDGTWKQLTFGDGFECALDLQDSTMAFIYASANGHLARTNSKGEVSYITPRRDMTGSQWKRHFVVDPKNPEVIFYAGNKMVLRSKDRGASWESIFETDQNIWEIFQARANPNVLYISLHSPGGVMMTSNAHDPKPHWHNVDLIVAEYDGGKPIQMGISDISIDEENPKTFWATIPRYDHLTGGHPKPKVIKCQGHHCEDWTGIAEGDQTLAYLAVEEVVHQYGTNDGVYVGTNAGVFYKEGKNAKWQKVEGLPHVKVNELEINYANGKLYAATFGRGLWEGDLIGKRKTSVVRKGKFIWNDGDEIFTDIVIKKKAHITLVGTVYVAQGVTITVEESGTLDEAGGRFVNRSGAAWGGVKRLGSEKELIPDAKPALLDTPIQDETH